MHGDGGALPEAGHRKKHPRHEMYPYLLRGLTINRATQVWALDTTYIPMAKGFVSRTAVVDWASRTVLAAKVAITLETCHVVEVLHEAFTRHGRLEMVNHDQGCQFNAQAFVHAVKEQGCQFSMDGRGAWTSTHRMKRMPRCCRLVNLQPKHWQRLHLKTSGYCSNEWGDLSRPCRSEPSWLAKALY